MKPTSRQFKSLCSLLVFVLQAVRATAGSQFTSHVTVNTPARSFTHGVGDPLPLSGRRSFQRRPQRPSFRSLRRPTPQTQGGGSGYPRMRPTIPFNNEESPRENSASIAPWQNNDFKDVSIPLLPPSPYKVDSPDPESLWPEGLFLPPIRPLHFGSTLSRRADTMSEVSSVTDPLDPYLLEGSEAIAAVQRAKGHGHLYFHEIPHIQSLLANQDLRVQNKLQPHRIASIRHTWPYNRP